MSVNEITLRIPLPFWFYRNTPIGTFAHTNKLWNDKNDKNNENEVKLKINVNGIDVTLVVNCKN